MLYYKKTSTLKTFLTILKNLEPYQHLKRFRFMFLFGLSLVHIQQM